MVPRILISNKINLSSFTIPFHVSRITRVGGQLEKDHRSPLLGFDIDAPSFGLGQDGSQSHAKNPKTSIKLDLSAQTGAKESRKMGQD